MLRSQDLKNVRENRICRSLDPSGGLKPNYMSGGKLPLEPVLDEFWFLRRTDMDGDSCL